MIQEPAARKALAGAVAMMLAACGGGGDSGATLELTASNYTLATQEALGASLSFSKPSRLLLATEDRGTAAGAADARRGALSAQAAATRTQTLPCDNRAGSMVMTVDDANNNFSVDAGDKATLQANNCQADGDTLDGRMSMVFNSVQGDPAGSVFTLAVSLTLDGFRVVSAGTQVTSNGRMDINMRSTDADTVTSTFRADGLSSEVRNGGTARTRTVSGFSLEQDIRPQGSSYTTSYTVAGRVASTGLDNRDVAVSTLQPLVVVGAASYPGSGQVLLTGARGRVRATAQPGGTLLLELDADGDGIYETRSTKTWSDMT